MSNNSNSKSGGIGIFTLLFLVFLTLKLAEIGQVATWSWWWVTSPLWIPFLLGVAIVILWIMFDLISKIVTNKK